MPMEKAAQKALSDGGAIYTCPMHPQIRHKGPGNCPICGMTLEPLVVTADEGPSVALRDMALRFWVGLALTIPVFVLEMVSHIPALGLHHLVLPRTSGWIQLVLSTPVVLWAGWPFFQRAWASVIDRSLNMFSLIAFILVVERIREFRFRGCKSPRGCSDCGPVVRNLLVVALAAQDQLCQERQ